MDLSLNITETTDSVDDLLRLFTAPERLDKQNSWKCESCGETVRARKQLSIYSAPSHLVLHLKRFRYGEQGKVTQPVAFTTELNLRPFLCVGSREAGRPLLYELRAVVVHVDKAGYSNFGHYVAYVRCVRGSTDAWYLLDDSSVTQVSQHEVLRQQAYLLLYCRSSPLPAEVPTSASAPRRAAPEAGPSSACRCRGARGRVCTFFACSDGLCTRCYQDEHGRPPPSAAAASAAKDEPPAEQANGVTEGRRPSKSEGTKAAPPAPKAPAVPPPAKPKKVRANDLCPCGSGKKYKKCHGAGN